MRLLNQSSREAACRRIYEAPEGWECEIREPKRNLDQNAKLWANLQDIAEQVEWYGQYLTKEDWKAVFSASLKQQKVVPGLDGGFVVCGQSTSKMTKSEFSDLLELIHAFGAEHGVRFGASE